MDGYISAHYNTRFEQPGYQIYSHMESLLLNAVTRLTMQKIEFVSKLYCENFDAEYNWLIVFLKKNQSY